MRIINAEFNELSPVLMEKFIEAGKLPNFKRLRDESQVFTTEAEDEDLEPWIQWVTMHLGVPFSEHGIDVLGEGHKAGVKSVWDYLSDAGRSVWVCGSMNSSYVSPINGWVLPDPWTTELDPYPAGAMDDYFRFVSANVQEHTRAESPLTRDEQVRFLKFMARHGLSPKTVTAVVGQLARERRGNVHWQRAALLDRFQFDLFRWYFKKHRPDFSTFFLNSTAHYQHRYWRNMEPEHFKIKPEPGEQAVFQDAILYGYQRMDELCGELLDLAGSDTTLMLSTALSQQPYLEAEDTGGKVVFRPNDFDELVALAGIAGSPDTSPVMTESFHVRLGDEARAEDAVSKLERLTLDGAQLLGVDRDGSDVRAGCVINSDVAEDAVIRFEGEDREVPFFDVFYKLDLMKSGMHHPDGILWIRTPDRRHEVIEERVPLVRIAPTQLEMLGVPVPDQMTGEPLQRDSAALHA